MQKDLNQNWLEWFIGLFEGDGTLTSHSKGFTFCIYSIHKDTILKIQSVLGFGNISFNEKLDKWSYRVEKRNEIFLILLILNGNLVLTHRYHNFIFIAKDFNERLFKGKPFSKKLDIMYCGTIPTLQDGWFSGFVDAEGHFGLPIESGRRFISQYISITFEIGQNGEKWLFEHLKILFNGKNLFTSNKMSGKVHNRIVFKGTKLGASPVTLVFEYFDNFHLFTKYDIYTE